ncbi:MAG: hypothetical protein OIF50_17000, partial [Flavobacteriaceae bacterium]|nr:hypothetical protein [Flavobacteriaceae bacterium]
FLHIAGTLGGVLAMVILPNPYHFEQRDPAILHSYWKPSWYTPLILSMRNILPYIVASAQLVFIANMAISYYRKEKN